MLLRVDTAGASHELLDWCREGRIRFSVGYELTETVRAAILQITRAAPGFRRLTRTAARAPTGRSPRSPATSI